MANAGEIQNGDLVKDNITGFKGIVIAVTHWLNGCERITIQPQKLQEHGKCPPAETFDCQQISIIKKSAVDSTESPRNTRQNRNIQQETPKRPGGDRSNISRAKDPI